MTTSKASEPPPEYIDAAGIARKLGISRESAYQVMQKVPHVNLRGAGMRRLLVKRTDLDAFLAENTITPEE